MKNAPSLPVVAAVLPAATSRPVWWARRPAVPAWLAPAQDKTPVPGWVHGALVLSLLAIDGLLYYTTNLNPTVGAKTDAVWFVRNAALDAVTAGLFYWNWAWLFPRTLSRGRVGRYLTAAVAGAAGFALLRLAVSQLVYRVLTTKDPNLLTWKWFVPFYLGLVAGGLLTILASSGVRITLDYLQEQRNRRELERQHLLTELAGLKTQINPHFLFNTLNNIYSLTSRKSDRAPEAVLRLAESMRYLLYDSAADTVLLAQELAHLRGYLDLQRLRLPMAEASTAIALHEHGTVNPAFALAPLLLLPLVENAFKHGDLAARPEAIRLELSVADDTLSFSVHNYVAPAGDLPPQPGGLGLHNLRRRLDLLYPGRYALEVRRLPGEYAVELRLAGGTR